MRRWHVRPARSPLRGVVRVPGDKSIAHRAVFLGSVATGRSRVGNVPSGLDVQRSVEAMRALGVRITHESIDVLTIDGVGLRGLEAPSRDIQCGNSGTTMRLLAGLLAAQSFPSRLVGDSSLSARPMVRLAAPLRSRGARIDGAFDPLRNDETAPLTIRGLAPRARLSELEFALPVPSAQVKSALLLSGLDAAGPTGLVERTLSRDHTERMLHAMGVALETMGPAVFLPVEQSERVLRPLEVELPGDLSSAAFVLVAATLVPGSRVRLRDVGLNPTRTGLLDVLRDMGAPVAVQSSGDRAGEPIGDAWAGSTGELRTAARVSGELALRAIDEIPALACAAAGCAKGASEFRDLSELRLKESDRISAIAGMMTEFGIETRVWSDGMAIDGGRRPRGGARIRTHGDHRIAMAAAVLALVADGETVVFDVECVRTSYPEFVPTMRGLGVEIEEKEGE